jgi:hypothetical protein
MGLKEEMETIKVLILLFPPIKFLPFHTDYNSIEITI